MVCGWLVSDVICEGVKLVLFVGRAALQLIKK